MTTKKDFEDFFENTSMGPGSVICKFDFESRENFTALIRCKLVDTSSDVTMHNYQAFIKWFMYRYSAFTHSGWVVRKTFPNMKKLIYRKIYACQHASFNKKTGSAQRKILKGHDCDAKMDFLIKIINRNTWKHDAMLRNGYNIIVHIKHQHTHPIHVKEALSLLKSDPKLDAEFIQYFENGMTPAVAKIYHENKILDAHQGNSNEILSNAHINPPETHINYLYSKWCESKSKNGECVNDFDRMVVKIEPCVSIEVKVDEEKNAVEDMPFRLSEPYSLAAIADEDFQNSLDNFNTEMIRLRNMFDINRTSDTLKTMKKLTGHLRNIKTVADAKKFVFCDTKKRN